MLGYWLKSPRPSDSNEYPQHMFLWSNKQNYPLIITKYPPYLFFRINTVNLLSSLHNFSILEVLGYSGRTGWGFSCDRHLHGRELFKPWGFLFLLRNVQVYKSHNTVLYCTPTYICSYSFLHFPHSFSCQLIFTSSFCYIKIIFHQMNSYLKISLT